MADKKRNDSYSHIVKYTGLFGGVQGLAIGMSIVRTKLIALILGPHGVGLLSLYNTTLKLVGDATTFGLSVSGVKRVSEAYESGDAALLRSTILQVRSLSLFTAILGTLVCILFSPLLSRYTFSWDAHMLHFIVLSPAVGFLAIVGGETAILKGTRQLRGFAMVSVSTLFASLLLSIPLFLLFGVSGIVPSMVLVAFAQMVMFVAYSFHRYPMPFTLSKKHIMGGMGVLTLGIGIVLGNVMNSGAELLVKSYINNVAGIETLGLYNAGFMMTLTYAGMAFSAMETDYFPRLSAVKGTGEELNLVVNRQIEVSLLLVAPLLVAFMIGMPIILPLFYSKSFMPATAFAHLMILAMYMRALKQPLAYLPLSKGHPWSYLLMEGTCAVFLVTLTIVFFHKYGLRGAGLGILINSVVDFIMLNTFMYYRYGYKISAPVVKYALLQLPLGIVAYGITNISNPWIYWVAGILTVLLSLSVSLFILHKKTRLWNSLKSKFIKSKQ